MKKLLVSIVLGSLVGAALAYVVVKARNNPLGKCYSLADTGGSPFFEKLVLKVNRVNDDQTLSFDVVASKQPENIQEMILLMQLQQGGAQIKPDAIQKGTVVQVQCPEVSNEQK